jgi:predicted membrane protein
VLVLSYILRIWELPFEYNKYSASIDGSKTWMVDYPSAIWLTFITLTTVGYGDIYP